MIEVTKAEDDDGDIAEEYNYDQEEFDDYEDEDFDSVSSSSSSHSFKSPPAPSETDRLDLMQVMSTEIASQTLYIVYKAFCKAGSKCACIFAGGLGAVWDNMYCLIQLYCLGWEIILIKRLSRYLL